MVGGVRAAAPFLIFPPPFPPHILLELTIMCCWVAIGVLIFDIYFFMQKGKSKACAEQHGQELNWSTTTENPPFEPHQYAFCSLFPLQPQQHMPPFCTPHICHVHRWPVQQHVFPYRTSSVWWRSYLSLRYSRVGRAGTSSTWHENNPTASSGPVRSRRRVFTPKSGALHCRFVPYTVLLCVNMFRCHFLHWSQFFDTFFPCCKQGLGPGPREDSCVLTAYSGNSGHLSHKP